MKAEINIYIILLLILSITINFTPAQTLIESSNVPRDVRHTVHTLYPTIKEFKWVQLKGGNFQVQFNNNILILKEDGTIVSSKSSTDKDAHYTYDGLPISIKKHFSLKYNPIHIKSITKSVDANGSPIFIITLANKEMLYYTENGELIRTTK